MIFEIISKEQNSPHVQPPPHTHTQTPHIVLIDKILFKIYINVSMKIKIILVVHPSPPNFSRKNS